MPKAVLPGMDLGVGRRVLIALYVPVALLFFALFWIACALDRVLPVPLGFPRTVAALGRSERWVAKVLTAAGALPAGARITRFEVRPFKRGEVFRSSLAAIDLEVEHGGDVRRLALVAKLSADFGTIAAQVISIFQRNALNEVELLRAHFADAAPRVYFAKVAGLAGRFCILLERLEPVSQIEEEAGCPLASAREVVACFARLHARHHRSDLGARVPKVPVRVGAFAIDFACSLAWGRERRTSRRIARGSWHRVNRPLTIVHGDARIRNVLFRGTAPEGHPIDPVLIDWQATRWGLGATDLAYFLLLSLRPETRAAHERELVLHYHAELVRAGVRGYDLATFEEDYRHATLNVMSLLFLPLLGGEQTLADDNRAAATSIAMVWHERVVAALETIDRAWVEDRYGIDTSTFRASAEWIVHHAHPLNSGARLVAAELARRQRDGGTAS